MRLKQNVIMILILSLLLGSMTLGLALKSEDTVEEPEVIENVMPESFKGNIVNNQGVPEEIVNLICDYMDDYFESMYTFVQVSTNDYFTNDIQAAISEYSTKLVLDARVMFGDDFKLDDAHYDLRFDKFIELDDDTYSVFLYEDDYLNFKCLDGITSETLDIENTFVIKKVNDSYKIESHEKVQSQNIVFDENEINSVNDVTDIYNYYCDNLKYRIQKEETYKIEAQTNSYVPNKSSDDDYDRNAAVAYLEAHWRNRNDDYYDFSEEGGNCQNLASQVLYAGGAPMDFSGEDVWYYESSSDNTVSWRTVQGFEEYVDYNDGTGVVCEEVKNIYYAEPGDIVHVGHSAPSHATVVSKIVNGHILLDSNSIDMKDMPLEVYIYANRKLYKVIGINY